MTSTRRALGLAALLCLLSFGRASAGFDPIDPPQWEFDLLGPAVPYSPYGYTLSGSDTSPYVVPPAQAGLVTLYLWLACSPDGGLGAMEARLDHTFAGLVNFTPAANVFNFGTSTDLRLGVAGCPTAPFLLGSILVFDSGSGGTMCLTPLPASGASQTADCSFPIPGLYENSVIGLANDGVSDPCITPGGLCSANWMTLRIRGYETRGTTAGQHYATGLSIATNAGSDVRGVDGMRVVLAGTDTPLDGLAFGRNDVTGSSFDALQAGDWTGFLSGTSVAVAAGIAVDLLFDLTTNDGTTIQDVATLLTASWVGTDLADGAGLIQGGAALSILQPGAPPTGAPVVAAPVSYELMPAVPNPVTGSATIRFALSAPSRVSLRIYDVSGRLVRNLEDGTREAGRHAIDWNGKDDAGHTVGAGIYFCEMTAGTYRKAEKLTIVR